MPPTPSAHTAACATRRVLAASVGGRGPAVMLVHGVAVGPGTFARAAAAVIAAGGRAIVPHRGGYARSAGVAPAADLDTQVDDLVGVLDDAGVERAVWAGVSGGATIALAAAMRRPDRVAGIVLHEPALGPLAADLHTRLLAAAAAVAAARDAGEGALVLAEALAGPGGWERVGAAERDGIRATGTAVRAEIAMFPAFAPTVDDLGALRRMPVVSSVGSRSGVERHRAGEVLVALTGAEPALTPSGHLVQIEAPAAFAGLAAGIAARAHTPTPIDEEDP